VSGRCSPTEALALLAPELSPMAAAEEITRAIRNNKCRVRCDNDVIKPHIAAIARVVPKLENDARWIADIESTGPGLGWPRGLNWKLEIDEVIALKLQLQSTTVAPTGRRSKGSRTQEEIRKFAAKEFGDAGWEGVATSGIIQAANLDQEFKRRVRPFPNRSTFERALGRKKH
jgi:hypothetical protein